MNETGSGIRDWMREMKGDMLRLDGKFEKFGDEIKNAIRFEVAVLKTETIADLRRRIDDVYLAYEKLEIRVRNNENAIREGVARRGMADKLINIAVGSGSAIAAILGAKHLF